MQRESIILRACLLLYRDNVVDDDPDAHGTMTLDQKTGGTGSKRFEGRSGTSFGVSSIVGGSVCRR